MLAGLAYVTATVRPFNRYPILWIMRASCGWAKDGYFFIPGLLIDPWVQPWGTYFRRPVCFQSVREPNVGYIQTQPTAKLTLIYPDVSYQFFPCLSSFQNLGCHKIFTSSNGPRGISGPQKRGGCRRGLPAIHDLGCYVMYWFPVSVDPGAIVRGYHHHN